MSASEVYTYVFAFVCGDMPKKTALARDIVTICEKRDAFKKKHDATTDIAISDNKTMAYIKQRFDDYGYSADAVYDNIDAIFASRRISAKHREMLTELFETVLGRGRALKRKAEAIS